MIHSVLQWFMSAVGTNLAHGLCNTVELRTYKQVTVCCTMLATGHNNRNVLYKGETKCIIVMLLQRQMFAKSREKEGHRDHFCGCPYKHCLFVFLFLIVSRHPVSSFLYLQIHDITGFLGNVCLMFHMYQLYVWIFPNGNCLLVLTEQMSNEKTCTTTNLHVKKRWKNKSNICF